MIILNTQQYLKDQLLVFSRYFTFIYLIAFFLIISFQTLVPKETSRLQSISRIVYFESNVYFSILLLCNALHSVVNMYWWTFARGLF